VHDSHVTLAHRSNLGQPQQADLARPARSASAVLDDDPRLISDCLAGLVLQGNPLCRQLDHVGHVHGVARARLQLDKLNPRWCPVCAVQPGHQAMSMRSERPLGIGDLGAAQFGGKTTLDVVDLRTTAFWRTGSRTR
jgi:hypothetical protein